MTGLLAGVLLLPKVYNDDTVNVGIDHHSRYNADGCRGPGSYRVRGHESAHLICG